jgi:hypothetical protein
MSMNDSDTVCVCVCGHDSPNRCGGLLGEFVCSYERSYM